MAENHQHHHHHFHRRPLREEAGGCQAQAGRCVSASRPPRRRTTATTPSRSTGRRVRTQAKNETREAAKANSPRRPHHG